ncbi:EIF4E2, partial [Symbiodinium necroappetens]
NLCYSLGPIFCSTGLDGAPHALLQRTSPVRDSEDVTTHGVIGGCEHSEMRITSMYTLRNRLPCDRHGARCTALTSLSSGAATQFSISIFMSLYGIIRAVYREVHLDLRGLDQEYRSSCFRGFRSRSSAVSQFRPDRQRGGSTKPPTARAPSLWRNLYGRPR